MRNVYTIAKTELRMLFCSPIMWVLLLIFVMQASGIFSGLCWRIAHNNEWGDGYFSPGSFGFIMGMWMSTCGSLHFYIPLLTMGLISRELSTGSIKLLYSSPISNAQIVLGKFFSPVMFAVILCLSRATLSRLFNGRPHWSDCWEFSCWLVPIFPSDCSCRA